MGAGEWLQNPFIGVGMTTDNDDGVFSPDRQRVCIPSRLPHTRIRTCGQTRQNGCPWARKALSKLRTADISRTVTVTVLMRFPQIRRCFC